MLASGPRACARGVAGPRDSEGARRERSRGSRHGEEEGKEEGDADEWDRRVGAGDALAGEREMGRGELGRGVEGQPGLSVGEERRELVTPPVFRTV